MHRCGIKVERVPLQQWFGHRVLLVIDADMQLPQSEGLEAEAELARALHAVCIPPLQAKLSP